MLLISKSARVLAIGQDKTTMPALLAVPALTSLSTARRITRCTTHIATSLYLAAALLAPVATLAAPGPQEANTQARVYDRDHKDYHNWDDRENQAWGTYQSDHHIKSHEFSKANKKDQSQYWNWRHAHPDKD